MYGHNRQLEALDNSTMIHPMLVSFVESKHVLLLSTRGHSQIGPTCLEPFQTFGLGGPGFPNYVRFAFAL